jgi:cell division protease FtsH
MQAMKALIFWCVILVSAFLLWQVVRSGSSVPRQPEISYSEFMTRIANGEVSKVTIAGSQVRAVDIKTGDFRVTAPPDQSPMLASLQQHGVEIWFRDQAAQGWPNWLLNLALLVLLAALWFFMIRQMQTRSRKAVDGSGFPSSSGSVPS